MPRRVVFSLALLTASVPAFADPKIDSAISVFIQTAADTEKLMTFCAMSRTMEAVGESDDPETKSEIERYLKQLGPDFEAAWKAFRETDQNSPEGKALNQAVDELGSQCPE
jgi:hypothetical protein